MRVGNGIISDIRYGGQIVQRLYAGSSLAWEREIQEPGGYEPETLAYVDRVQADGGEIMDIDYVDSVYKKLKELNYIGNATLHLSINAGIKKDSSGYVSKMYNLFGVNDAGQLAGSDQPQLIAGNLYFSGNNHMVLNSPLIFPGDYSFLSTFNKDDSKSNQRMIGGPNPTIDSNSYISVISEGTNISIKPVVGGTTTYVSAEDYIVATKEIPTRVLQGRDNMRPVMSVNGNPMRIANTDTNGEAQFQVIGWENASNIWRKIKGEFNSFTFLDVLLTPEEAEIINNL